MKRFRNTEYFVSEDGRVFRDGRQLKGSKTKGGYIQIRVYANESRKMIYIHRMVAEIYMNQNNINLEINHINGIKHDNRKENLEWVTSSENKKHAFNLGLRKKGETCTSAILKQNDVDYIRQNYKPRDKKYGGKALSEKYNVHPTTISFIVNNINWKQ